MFATMVPSKSKSGLSILKGPEVYVEHNFLHRVFEERISKNSSYQKSALIYEDKGISKRITKYIEMNENANQLANKILEIINESKICKANSDGDWIIAICMRPSDNMVTTLLAVWKAGAAYLPINSGFPQIRVEHILNESKPALVIYDRTYKNPNYFSKFKSITFENLKQESLDKEKGNIPDDSTLTKGDEDSKAIIIYTSGSTGLPKGVRISHTTFLHRIQWQLETYPFADSETHCIAKTTLSFIDHVAEIWCPLFSGKALVVVPYEIVQNPENFIPILDEYSIQRLLGVPTLLRSVLMFLNMHESNKTKYMLSRLRIWISSGETLTLQLANEFFEYFEHGKQALLNFYGCTELSCDVCSYEITSKKQLSTMDKVPLGSPVPNTIIYILDQNKKVVKQGEIGEIYCAGVLITDGYTAGRDPEPFRENHLESNPPYHRMYRTGDFGMMKDGLLFYEGRRDTQIKVRGHRVDLSEVEKRINELSYVGKSAVLVYHAMQTDQALVAFIETKRISEKPKSSMDIEKDLKSKLADYMIPQVEIVEEFPFLANGKVDRQELIKMYEDEASGNHVEVRVEVDLKHVPKEQLNTARQVFQIIGQSIGKELRKKVSMKSNFFELGGNSMNSLYTVIELRNKGFYIGITDFLTADSLGVVLQKISLKKVKTSNDLNITTDMELVRKPLDDSEKELCMNLLAQSFYTKSEIDQFLPNLKFDHYIEVLSQMWEKASRNGLSFMVKNENSDLVGVSLNFDAKDEPEVVTDNPLKIIFDFLDSIETPVLESEVPDPEVGKTLHCLMLGTAENLKAKDNIAIIAFMESEIIRIAKEKGYEGILTTNTNPLTAQFGESVFGYETVDEVQVNKYVDENGKCPFAKAPNSTKAVVMFKEISKN